jgi:voltage-gated potassium channel
MAERSPLHSPRLSTWRITLRSVVFELRTPAGRFYNLLILVWTTLSVLTVVLDSVPSLQASYPVLFKRLEWIFTGIFSLDFLARLLASERPLAYLASFFGVVDALAVLPGYLSLLLPGLQSLLVVRSLQLLRIFRLLKLIRFGKEAQTLWLALRSSLWRIGVFLTVVFLMQLIIAALIYLIEGEEYGFDSIPRALYWTIVTMTTVGYGDLTPHTPIGQVLASLVMLIGYGIIAVPTGMVTYSLARQEPRQERCCSYCGTPAAEIDARFCYHCGESFPEFQATPPGKPEE